MNTPSSLKNTGTSEEVGGLKVSGPKVSGPKVGDRKVSGDFLFRIRGYTPLPIVVLFLFFARPNLTTIILGGILAVAGSIVRIWSVAYAGKETRSSVIGASRLAQGGPYGYVRNPIYLANLMMYAGYVVIANIWLPWLLLLVMITFAVQYRIIVKEEESVLAAQFGETYLRYCDQVPAWIPDINHPGADGEVTDLGAAIRAERGTFISELLVVGILLLRTLF